MSVQAIMSIAEAQREFALGEAELARRSLLAFTLYTSSAYRPNWHHERLAAALDGVLAGRIRRLMVFMPPQHGKSELVSRRFPAYALGRNPDLRLITASYSANLASEMSKDVQRIMDSTEYRRLFPKTRLATDRDPEVRTAARFGIPGFTGTYRAAGVGQGITGSPMTLGIIDDPVAGRAEAESEAFRKMVWDWYATEFFARRTHEDVPIVLTMTRWHTDDLAGRLLELAAKDRQHAPWHVVSFPALCDEERPEDPRALGEALWPSRFSAAALATTRAGTGVYDWSALYQQRPVPPGGALAQRAWFKIMDQAAMVGNRLLGGAVLRRCRCWDLAGTRPVSGRDPDWTVGTKLAKCENGLWIVEHVVRVRETAAVVDKLMLQTAVADGMQCLVREWQDPGAAGKAVIEAHRRMLAGCDYEPLPASGEKTMQWRPFLVQAEGGNVWLAPGEWNQAWLDEMALVPYGLHDDQADSSAGAFNALATFRVRGPSVAAVMPSTGPSRPVWKRVR